jgi:hypothetical protein
MNAIQKWQMNFSAAWTYCTACRNGAAKEELKED